MPVDLQVVLGLLGDVARVTAVALAGDRVGDEAVDDQRLALHGTGRCTAVSGSGIRIMSDSWISWNPRIDEPSKPWPSSNVPSLEHVAGIGDVLHDAGQVAEAEVDELDSLVVDQRQHFGWCALLHVSSSWRTGSGRGGQPRGRIAACPVAISRPLPDCERTMNWTAGQWPRPDRDRKTRGHGAPAGLRAADRWRSAASASSACGSPTSSAS